MDLAYSMTRTEYHFWETAFGWGRKKTRVFDALCACIFISSNTPSPPSFSAEVRPTL